MLIQSLAIMEYLDETHPEPPLLPKGALDRAYVRAVAQIIACEMHPLNNLRTLKYVKRSYKLDDEGVNTWYRHWIAEGFAMLEGYLVREGRAGQLLLRRHGDDRRLLPRPAGVQRAALRVRSRAVPDHRAGFGECMKLDAFASTQPSGQPDAA